MPENKGGRTVGSLPFLFSILISLFYFHHSYQYHLVFLYLFIACLPPLAFQLHLLRPWVLFSAVSQSLEPCPE